MFRSILDLFCLWSSTAITRLGHHRSWRPLLVGWRPLLVGFFVLCLSFFKTIGSFSPTQVGLGRLTPTKQKLWDSVLFASGMAHDLSFHVLTSLRTSADLK